MLTKTPFDFIAKTYDTDFTNSAIGKLQRNKVWNFFTNETKNTKSKKVLEINCGTGNDALWLADKGFDVIATDISSEMIAIANSKNKIENHPNLHFEICGFNNLIHQYQQYQFDMVFSNFAGLNCLSKQELINLDKDLAILLKPKGQLIVVLLGKYCVVESLYFLFKFDWKKITRRKRKANAYLSENNYQETWCYSYQELETIFSSFKLIKKKPIGLFIPPSYFEKTMKRWPVLLYLLQNLDSLFGGISNFSNFGDHYILHLEKTT